MKKQLFCKTKLMKVKKQLYNKIITRKDNKRIPTSKNLHHFRKSNLYLQYPYMWDQLKSKAESMFPFKRKKAIENWDFILVFEQYYRGEIQLMFSSLKCLDDLKWTVVEHPMEKQVLLLIKISDRIVREMAHELKILKKKNKKSFQLSLKDINTLIYTTDKKTNPSVYSYLCFLRARMLPQNKEIFEQEKYSAFNKDKESSYLTENGKLFTQQEELRAKYHYLVTYSEKIQQLQNSLNDIDMTKQPFNIIMNHPGFVELVPIQKVSQVRPLVFGSVKDQVGPNIDTYFDFVNFLQKWLIFPSIVGILTVTLNYSYQYTADTSPYDFIYALIIMIWSILFVTRWQEVQKWTKIKQSGGSSELWTEHQDVISKRGMERHQSFTTGQIQYYMSMKMRVFIILVSNLACLSMIAGTLVFVVYSLNARGFIDPHHKLFYSETVSGWAKSGGIFDSQTFWSQIPNIIHVVVTNGFDENFYRPIVKKISKFQRHNTRKGYENSIILKYFIFEFIITFADLFYIAFVRLDIEGLREQLVSLFFIDIVRRLVAETLLPWIKKSKRSYDLKSLHKQKNRQSYYSNQMSDQEQLQYGAILEVNKEDYEQFDDFLEIISNFGYLVMISSCFPLAPFLILIAHEVQILQDSYKIVHIFKRKLPQNYIGMGRWKNILVFLCYISIVTNIMLFAFSSQQVTNYFPKMYESGKDLLYGNTNLTTLIGGAATGLLNNVISLDNIIPNMTQFVVDPQDINIAQFVDREIKVETDTAADQIVNVNDACAQSENCQTSTNTDDVTEWGNQQKPTFVLKQFKPPKKESQTMFLAILFFIEHFFLLLFLGLRDMLKKRKSEAEIFLQRRQYKRRIKKNLPKNILNIVCGNSLINALLKQQLGISEQEHHQDGMKTSQSKLRKSSATTETRESVQSQKTSNQRMEDLFMQQKNESKQRNEEFMESLFRKGLKKE